MNYILDCIHIREFFRALEEYIVLESVGGLSQMRKRVVFTISGLKEENIPIA